MRTDGKSGPERREQDAQGVRILPGSAYYGIATARALEAVAVAGRTLSAYPGLVAGLVAVKQAAALVNNGILQLDDRRTRAIMMACEDARRGTLVEQFVVDMLQADAVTAADGNANEVLANRSIEHMGQRRGDYAFVDPRLHVGLHQPPAMVYALAAQVAVHEAIRGALAALAALPVTPGEHAAGNGGNTESAWGACGERLAALLLQPVSIDGTATRPGFGELLQTKLADLTGVPARAASEDAPVITAWFESVSGVLKQLAVALEQGGEHSRPHSGTDAVVTARDVARIARGHLSCICLAADGRFSSPAALPVMTMAMLDVLRLLRGGCLLLGSSG